MEALINYVGKSIVDHPEAFTVERINDGDRDSYQITADADDFGQVIGRRGRTIRALRTLARAAASRDGRQADVEIVE